MESKEDYLFVLYSLIAYVAGALDDYKHYNNELITFLNMKHDNSEETVDKYTYMDFTNKTHDVSMSLIMYLVDCQESSMSYLMFRKIIDKKASLFKIKELSHEIKEMLNELRDVRNWTFHNPQSSYVASKEYLIKQLPTEFRKPEYFTYRFKPIIIDDYLNYDIYNLISLQIHIEKRIVTYEQILEQMINDYECLLGEKVEVQFKVIEEPKRAFDSNYAVAQLSMSMQRGYDGSDQSFKKSIFPFV